MHQIVLLGATAMMTALSGFYLVQERHATAQTERSGFGPGFAFNNLFS